MRKGYIGSFQLGYIGGANKALEITSDVTGESGCDIENIFYSSAFQAGIDKFVLPQLKEEHRPKSLFVTNHTSYINENDSKNHYQILDNAFSNYLPEDWKAKEEYRNLFGLENCLTEMIDAMATGTSLLTVNGIPDPVEYEHLLPSELSVPITALVSSFQEVSASSLVTQVQMDAENVNRFREIIESDLFAKYVSCQSEFDDPGAKLPMVLDDVARAGRDIVRRNPALLQLRKSGASLLSFTPKLIDAVFGKLPGAVADVASKVGIEFLENRRRLVIYDFKSSFQQVLYLNLVRMIGDAEKAANKKIQPTQKTRG